MRYYVSGPMTGYPGDNRAAFAAATKRLRAAGHQVVDPTEMDMAYNDAGNVGDGSLSPLWRMFIARDMSIILSSQFDRIMVLDGWEQSRGARMEVMAAVMCGTRVVDEGGIMVSVRSIDLEDCQKKES